MEAEKMLDEGTMGIEAARRFTGLGRTALYDLMNRGELAFTKIGTRRLIPKRALIGVLASNLTTPPENSR